MNQIRFTVMLAILILVLLVLRFITQPFAPENMLIPLGETLGILLIGIIWGLIIYLPIRLFKGPDHAPDFPNFIFYSATIFSILFILYSFI